VEEEKHGVMCPKGIFQVAALFRGQGSSGGRAPCPILTEFRRDNKYAKEGGLRRLTKRWEIQVKSLGMVPKCGTKKMGVEQIWIKWFSSK